MKIREFMEKVYADTGSDLSFLPQTCDTLKTGNPDAELRKIAVTMFGTVDVIRQAGAWGANLLIVHEPFYYDHWDSREFWDGQTGLKKQVMEEKRRLAAECGMTVYRYHDHPHFRAEDFIALGEVKYFGLKGQWTQGARAHSHFTLDTPLPVREIAKTLEKNLNIARVRLCGDADIACQKIALCFGTPGRIEEELEDNDLVLTGEICEWAVGEYVRDCAQLGHKKAVIVMGHCCSERDGMRFTAEWIQEKYPEFPARYFECGDVYSYAD